MDRGFPRSCRILLGRDFERAMKDGFRSYTWNLIVFTKENDLGIPRLGLAVGRKVGNAVSRNRWKRLTREVFRNSLKSELGGRDLVVAVKAVPGFDRKGDRSSGSGSDRFRGDRGTKRPDKKPEKRVIPTLAELEGELVNALRWINRKMADQASVDHPDLTGQGV